MIKTEVLTLRGFQPGAGVCGHNPVRVENRGDFSDEG